MTTIPDPPTTVSFRKKPSPFRRAVLRGLAFVLPPLLTLVFFIWVWSIIERYLLRPAEGIAAAGIILATKDVISKLPADLNPDEVEVLDKDGRRQSLTLFLAGASPAADLQSQVTARRGRVVHFHYRGQVYVAVGRDRWIPEPVYERVEANPGDPRPVTVEKYYDRYVRLRWLQRSVTVPIFVCLLTLVLYITGKFVAAGVGRFTWRTFDGVIGRMPIIRDVYSAVKQMTDLVLSEHEMQFMRVVAVEYPRKGIWVLAFVTGEGFRQVRAVADEPIYSLLVPTSPMPATGFTIMARKTDCIELEISVDQAIQFVVSCGVVVPPLHQWSKNESNRLAAEEVRKQLAGVVAEREGSNSLTEP